MIFEIYTEKKPNFPNLDEWHWRLVRISGNRPVAFNAEPYSSLGECEASIHLVMLTDYSTSIVKLSEKQKKQFLDEESHLRALVKKAKILKKISQNKR